MMQSMPWRPVPSSLLVDPRWLQLTLQERGAFVSLVLSADLEGVIDLPGSATADRLLAGLGQISLKAARAMLSRLEEMNLVWTVKDGLQVDVLELNNTPSLEGNELTENQDRPLTAAERQKRYRERHKRNEERNATVTTTVTERNGDRNENVTETVTKSVTQKVTERNENVTPSEEIRSEKDQNTKGNVKEIKKGDAARAREKSPSPLPVEPEQPPPEGTPARSIYNAITTDQTLSLITKHPADYAQRVIEAWPKLDVPSEIRRACLWLGGQKERKRKSYRDGRAFLSNWLRRALEDQQDIKGFASGPVPAAEHDAFAEAKAAPGKYKEYTADEVFGGKRKAVS